MINKNKGLFSGVASGMLWGLDTVITGIILINSPFIEAQNILIAPFVCAFLHDMFSSLWMFLYIIFKGKIKDTIKLLKTTSAKYICIASLLGGPIGMASYLLAIKYIGVGYTASISAIYPAIGAFWAYVFLKEKLSKRAFIGLIISISSVIMLGYSPFESLSNNYIIGFLFALICVLGWSLESVLCAYAMKDDKIDPTQALQIRQFVSTIFYGLIIIPFIGGIDLSIQAFMSNISLVICFASLVGTASYVFYYTSIDLIGPVKATGLNITYCIWAMIFDIAFLGNSITLKLILCSILIILGSILVSKN